MNPDVLVIGSGIGGLSTAINIALTGKKVIMVSPYASERSQSVMAAGGINAAINNSGENDSPLLHCNDTLKAGCFLENEDAVRGLCDRAPLIIEWLESIGVVFNRKEDRTLDARYFGGQEKKRTVYAGAATGKLIVTALVRKCRELEAKGMISRRIGLNFYQALIKDNQCYGAVFYNHIDSTVEAIYADNTVVATGGMNRLFGKTTGSSLCDGYAVGKLFEQGVVLRNLEFIQYHPTTIETAHKRMLITEAARGEGGRLFYIKDSKRVYFMEDMYGEKGNLMTRDVVSREIYNAPSSVYLDITFLGEEHIKGRLREVYNLCLEYLKLDVTKEPIPVAPSVHFFMGGIAVDNKHRTNISNLYAVGECASIYHGANRLGGNSLLGAVYGGVVVSEALTATASEVPDFSDEINRIRDSINKRRVSESMYPATYIYRELAGIMNDKLGIVRNKDKLSEGIDSIDFYIKAVEKMAFDPDITVAESYSVKNILLLSKAILMSALFRKESRGAHYREDYKERLKEYEFPTLVSLDKGEIKVKLQRDI